VMAGRALIAAYPSEGTAASTDLAPISNHAVRRHDKLFTATAGSFIDDLLLTVPAFHPLGGLQDDVSHHKRRYRLHRLLKVLPVADLSPRRYFCFNYLLFLPILAARRLMRRLKIRVASENEINIGWFNRAPTTVFRFDVRTAPWLRPPIGFSSLVIATRT
jgi:hypothetical protein